MKEASKHRPRPRTSSLPHMAPRGGSAGAQHLLGRENSEEHPQGVGALREGCGSEYKFSLQGPAVEEQMSVALFTCGDTHFPAEHCLQTFLDSRESHGLSAPTACKEQLTSRRKASTPELCLTPTECLTLTEATVTLGSSLSLLILRGLCSGVRGTTPPPESPRRPSEVSLPSVTPISDCTPPLCGGLSPLLADIEGFSPL